MMPAQHHQHSPWLSQVVRTRPLTTLEGSHDTDVVIVGGGIAGIATAYYMLKYTDQQVAIVEGGQVAHGATGHNGGFLASYFERTFSSIVQEFGLDLAAEAQQAIESAWDLLDAMRRDASLTTPVWQFTGYAACSTLEEVVVHLRNNALRIVAGLSPEKVLVAATAPYLADIPDQYRTLYTILPHEDILALIETTDTTYTAILPARKGCMNSALLCEELVTYLLATYPERFVVFEHTPVRVVTLGAGSATLTCGSERMVTARAVVLCTNGFEHITIVNTAGAPIDESFHHLVRGIVGYMAGYTEARDKPPIEISYLPKQPQHDRDIYEEEPYFYLTRRPYDLEGNEGQNLISVGGPEALLDDTNQYRHEHPYPEEARQQIDTFLQQTYQHGPRTAVTYQFMWNGLMGFTPNGVRCIGPEPRNPVLYYNLGCNGVGLLPAIYGGRKIAQYVVGEHLPPSIFDPRGG